MSEGVQTVEGLQATARSEAAAAGVEAVAPVLDGPAHCPECSAAFVGDYCHACGEKRPESRDLSLRHFFSEAAQELTSVEHSKLFYTIWALLFRPGFLTREWAMGRRKRYLKPLNLCLGLIALSLFAYSVYKPVSTFDLEKMIREQKREDTIKLFERFAAKKHMEVPELFDRLSEKWQHNMSLSALVLIGGYALVLQIIFMFSRRYFVEHLVFAMHFVSFSMLTLLLLWPVYFFIGVKQSGANIVVSVCKWLVDMVYMYFAVRTVYGLGTVKTLSASVVLVLGYFLVYILLLIVTLLIAIINVGLS